MSEPKLKKAKLVHSGLQHRGIEIRGVRTIQGVDTEMYSATFDSNKLDSMIIDQAKTSTQCTSQECVYPSTWEALGFKRAARGNMSPTTTAAGVETLAIWGV